MLDLNYKTRGNSTPKGKPRIYLGCHPEDVFLYQAKVCNLLLQSQNCAVWYHGMDEMFPSIEEMELAFSQMQLFVVPVTARLLSDPNCVIDRELPVAMQLHVPILPLVMEDGIDDMFFSKFGNLQYLVPGECDSSAIPFAEKLDTYLNSVLIGEELTVKIRAAFDAYIFMSYRKKDRKFAQSLMRLIHSIPVCRDVAIWYDEYLTPGENFNDSILNALKRCELFTLVVTPNLINEDNYVLSTEYPSAANLKKMILPVEMVETDKKVLYEKFNALPECIPGTSGELFDEAFFRAVRSVAIEEKASSREHDFFIGLAYLDGIDVEVDHTRALELITDAAEHGLAEAMEKLAIMYHTGKGVERDYVRSVHWLARLAEERRKIFEKDQSSEHALSYLTALQKLENAQFSLTDMVAAKVTLEQMKAISDMFVASDDNAVFRKALADSYHMSGKVLMAEGHITEADHAYHTALDMRLQIWNETKNLVLVKDIISDYIALGKMALSADQYEQAYEYYKDSMNSAQVCFAQEESVSSKEVLANAYNNLANVLAKLQKIDEAEEYYRKAEKLFRELCSETGSAAAKRGLAVSYTNLASNYFSKRLQNIIRKAADDTSVVKLQELLLQAHALYEEIHTETKTVQAKRDLAASYHQLFHYGGQSDSWKEYVNRELELRIRLAEDTGTMEDVGALASCYHAMGKAFEKEGGFKQGLPYYEKELRLLEWFANQNGTEKVKLDLASSYEDMGKGWKSKKNWKETIRHYERALEIRKELADNSEVPVFKKQLVKSYNNLGDLYSLRLMDFRKACVYYQNALEVLEKLGQSDSSDSIKSELIDGNRHLGRILADLKCWEDALSYYLKAYKIIEQCSSTSDSLKRSTVKIISDLYWKLGRLEDAIAFGKKLRKIADEIVDKEKDRGTLDILGESHRHLYLLYREAGQHGNAKEHCQRAMEAYKLALDHYEKQYAAGREDARTYIKQCCFLLGEITRGEGLFSQSKAYFEKALPICEQKRSENRKPTLDSVYRDEVDFVKRQLEELEEEIKKNKFSFASIFNFLRR